MTETSPLLTMARSDGTSPHGSVGILCPNTECVIIDTETGESQPSNNVGEFWARGPQNMKGECKGGCVQPRFLRCQLYIVLFKIDNDLPLC